MSSRPGTAPAAPESKDFIRKTLTSSSSAPSHKSLVTALAWSSSGRKLATASSDGVVKVWAVSADSVTSERSFKPEHDFVHSSKECPTCLVFHPKRDEQLLVVGSHTSRVWALSPKGTASVVCEADTPEAIAATWDTHDNILVAQLHNKLARIDMRKAAEKDKKRAVDKLDIGSGDEVTDVRFIDRGRRVLVATQHGVEVRGWPNFRDKLTVLDGHAKHGGRDGGVTAMAIGREELDEDNKRMTRLLATGGADTLICIWDLHQAVPHTIIYRPDEAVRALSFSADHALLAYCQDHVPGQPSTVEVMDTKTGHHVTTVPLSKGTEVLAFNPRYHKLLAFAEPCVTSSRDRDNKVKEVTACNVMLVQLK